MKLLDRISNKFIYQLFLLDIYLKSFSWRIRKKNKSRIFLTSPDLMALSDNQFKLLLFMFDQILLRTDLDVLQESISSDPDELLFNKWGQYHSQAKDCQKVANRIWGSDYDTIKESRSHIKGTFDSFGYSAFHHFLIRPYLAQGMMPTVSSDLFHIFMEAYLKKLGAPDRFYKFFQFGDGTPSGSFSLEEMEITEKLTTHLTNVLCNLFENAFFKLRHNCEIVISTESMGVAYVLSRMENVELRSLKNYRVIKPLFNNVKNISDIVPTSFEIDGNLDSYKTTANLVVPNLSEVPVSEIYKFRRKDNIKSLDVFCRNFLKKNPDADENDIIHEINECIEKLCLQLAPGKSRIGLDILSNIPSPIGINPVGVFSLFKSVEGYKEKKQYQFAIDYIRAKKWFK